MAQFPFAHTIEMTYRLHEGDLQIETVLKNLVCGGRCLCRSDSIRISKLTDAPRDQWKAHLPAREHVVLSKVLVPTGETKKMDLADPFPLVGPSSWTTCSQALLRNAEFSVEGVKQKISVVYGPKYPVAVAYAPPGKEVYLF